MTLYKGHRAISTGQETAGPGRHLAGNPHPHNQHEDDYLCLGRPGISSLERPLKTVKAGDVQKKAFISSMHISSRELGRRREEGRGRKVFN